MSAAETGAPVPHTVERFDGGAKLMAVAGLVGVLGLVVALVGLFVDTERAAHGYLIGFSYWVGVAVASLIFLAILHTAKAKWHTVVRRALEVQAGTVGVFVILAIPFFLTLSHLYIWTAHDEAELHALLEAGRIPSEEAIHHLHHKQAYLNVPFFLVRQAIYFASWIVISHLLLKWSRAQDVTGALDYTVKARKLSPGSLPLLALTITFASFDWLMSLTPLWQSTIFGVYYFAGSLLAGIAVWTLFTVNSTGKNGHGSLATAEHLHNLGKLLLAFTAFWAYIAFSQLLLVWLANLPEEAPFYYVRINGPWLPFSIGLAVTHFIAPFFLLLSRNWKRRPGFLGFMSVYILIVHFLDMMWLVLPSRYPLGFTLSIWDIASWVGVGGIAVAFGVWRMRGTYAVPVKDPYLPESLRYVQP